MPRLVTILTLFVLTSFGATATSGAEALIHNAEIHPLGTALPDLERAFATLRQRVTGPAWVTYTVPMVAGRQMLCCSRDSSRCSLERTRGFFLEGDPSGPSSTTLRVLLRIENHRLTDIRAFSDRCHLGAGGLPVYVWEGVPEQQSLDLLMAEAAGGRKTGERALLAIAHHGQPEVDRLLEDIAREELLPRFAEEAIFWLGEARGDGGFDVLARLRRDLDDTELREKLTFALHLNEAPGALPMLIEMARQEPEHEVRSQALFWLSQEAGEKAVAAIVEASEEDPELEVKERAIFALSQLPPERGVPLLIRYAETHPHREIRKKAIFWLGQTEDPRALDFIEEILLR